MKFKKKLVFGSIIFLDLMLFASPLTLAWKKPTCTPKVSNQQCTTPKQKTTTKPKPKPKPKVKTKPVKKEVKPVVVKPTVTKTVTKKVEKPVPIESKNISNTSSSNAENNNDIKIENRLENSNVPANQGVGGGQVVAAQPSPQPVQTVQPTATTLPTTGVNEVVGSAILAGIITFLYFVKRLDLRVPKPL